MTVSAHRWPWPPQSISRRGGYARIVDTGHDTARIDFTEFPIGRCQLMLSSARLAPDAESPAKRSSSMPPNTVPLPSTSAIQSLTNSNAPGTLPPITTSATGGIERPPALGIRPIARTSAYAAYDIARPRQLCSSPTGQKQREGPGSGPSLIRSIGLRYSSSSDWVPRLASHWAGSAGNASSSELPPSI
jgi:hypothetical protein